jgi:hypothetical protein
MVHGACWLLCALQNVKCLYDSSIADEVTWGLKYVLGDVIPEEKDKTMGDTLPMSKGLKHFLQDNLINVPLTMVTPAPIVPIYHMVIHWIPL